MTPKVCRANERFGAHGAAIEARRGVMACRDVKLTPRNDIDSLVSTFVIRVVFDVKIYL